MPAIAPRLTLDMAPGPRPEVPAGPYAVAGLRRAGVAAAQALRRHASSTEVVGYERFAPSLKRRDKRRLVAAGVQLRLGDEGDELGGDRDPSVVIKSPGIPFDAPLIEAAARRGIPVIDELELGWRLSGSPMLAVTGTNGKTTVASLARAVLECSGLAVTLAGNTGLGPALSSVAPDPDWVVCEVSSFQLEGCPALMPELAIFTNLTRDHLARHGTIRRYGELKRRLFIRGDRTVPVAIIDVGDRFGCTLADDVERLGGRVIRVGSDQHVDYEIQSARWDLRSATVELQTPTGPLELSTRLPGLHNARNVAAAVAVGDLFGLDRGQLIDAVTRHVGPPGRLEVLGLGLDFDVILDCAASPASVVAGLRTVRAALPASGLVHVVLGVLGTPEDDHLRAMGRVAGELADSVILTAGSLRPRAPTHAIAALLAGVHKAGGAKPGGAKVRVVSDRRDAIRLALRQGRPGDVVIILGRGDVSEATHDRRVDDRGTVAELV